LLETLPEQRKHTVLAILHRDFDQLSVINHTLKGACCYTGTPALKQRVLELEKALENKDTCETQTTALISAIDDLLAWQDAHDLGVVFDI
jgi:two-component system sensor histidine kinase BarA